MCEAAELTVDKLRRVAIGGLAVEGISPGNYRLLSKKQLKNVTIGYKQKSDRVWSIIFSGDHKQFVFNVELDENDRPRVFVNIDTKDGLVRHCKVQSAHIVGRRILGIHVGVKKMKVRCLDSNGDAHSGTVRYTKV